MDLIDSLKFVYKFTWMRLKSKWKKDELHTNSVSTHHKNNATSFQGPKQSSRNINHQPILALVQITILRAYLPPLQIFNLCSPMLLCRLSLPWGSLLSQLKVNETHSARQHVTWLDQGTFRNESCERFQNKSIWSCEAAQNIHEFYRKDKRNVEKVEEGWLQTSHLQLLEFPAAFVLGQAR